jgi:hypothetical protein
MCEGGRDGAVYTCGHVGYGQLGRRLAAAAAADAGAVPLGSDWYW